MYFRVLRLLFYSADSKHKLAMGGAYGIFWGLTPTVGIQISALTLLAAVIYFFNKVSNQRLKWFDFNLPIAITLTWISNPANAPILYFIFYYIGALLMPDTAAYGFQEFIQMLEPLLSVGGMFSSLDSLGEYFSNMWLLLKELGSQILIPMILGSLVLAIPASALSYFGFRYLLHRGLPGKKT